VQQTVPQRSMENRRLSYALQTLLAKEYQVEKCVKRMNKF
jgi:hypothetical protein